MNTHRATTPYLIIGSFVIALLISIIPMPDWAQHLRPQWLTLTLIYWCLMLPERVGIATGWLTGLLLDIISGSLLGSHALTLSLISFITLNIYQRTRIFPLWQQSLVVFALLIFEQLLHFWIIGITREVTPGYEFWLPPIIGLFIWPWLFIIMSEIQHRLRNNL